MANKNYYLAENITTLSTDSSLSFSEKSVGAGYYKKDNPLHTCTYELSSFEGLIKLQGTLMLDPADDDWFDIQTIDVDVSNGTFNFTGHFSYLRLAYNVQSGGITTIRYTF
jgi:hypothetical protein